MKEHLIEFFKSGEYKEVAKKFVRSDEFKIWLIYIISVLIILLLSGCKVAKDAERQKVETVIENDLETTYTEITTDSLKGGEIRTRILPITERPRDIDGKLLDFIDTYRDGGLTKTIHYKPDGTVHVDCDLDAILRTIKKEFKQLDNSTSKKKEKLKLTDLDLGFDPNFIIFGIIALMLIAMLIVFLFYKSINKNSKLIQSTLERL